MKEFEHRILDALVVEGRSEAMVNAVQVAGPNANYESVFGMVMEMENKNYVKLVYCQYPTIINIQLTLVGKDAQTKRTTT